jgi:hypothetical protein
MIVNTHVSDKSNRIRLTPLGDRTDISIIPGEEIPYLFRYDNKLGLIGIASFLIEDVPLSFLSEHIVNGANGGVAGPEVVPDINLQPGIYTFVILVTDTRGAAKRLEYRRVLFDFPMLKDIVLNYNSQSDSYEVTGLVPNYNGPENLQLVIPEYGNGPQGIKPITRIGNGAFKDNPYIVSVSLSKNITSIGNLAFAFIPKLSVVSLLRTESIVQLDGNSSFDGNIVGRTIRVPSSLLSEYRADPKWNEYTTNIYEL